MASGIVYQSFSIFPIRDIVKGRSKVIPKRGSHLKMKSDVQQTSYRDILIARDRTHTMLRNIALPVACSCNTGESVHCRNGHILIS